MFKVNTANYLLYINYLHYIYYPTYECGLRKYKSTYFWLHCGCLFYHSSRNPIQSNYNEIPKMSIFSLLYCCRTRYDCGRALMTQIFPLWNKGVYIICSTCGGIIHDNSRASTYEMKGKWIVSYMLGELQWNKNNLSQSYLRLLSCQISNYSMSQFSLYCFALLLWQRQKGSQETGNLFHFLLYMSASP